MQGRRAKKNRTRERPGVVEFLSLLPELFEWRVVARARHDALGGPLIGTRRPIVESHRPIVEGRDGDDYGENDCASTQLEKLILSALLSRILEFFLQLLPRHCRRGIAGTCSAH